MGFEWPEWALDALSGAGIEPHEVLQVLNSTGLWPRRAYGPGGLEVLAMWGRSTAGRPLIVGVRQIDRRAWQILAAREMTPEQLIEFEKWERRPGDDRLPADGS